MNNYLLVENRKVIYLDMIWRPRMFQNELQDLGLMTDVLFTETEPGYLKINDSFEIIPVTEVTSPEYDPRYERLSGPHVSYGDTFAEKVFIKEPNPIDNIKTELKSKISSERYNKEIVGFKHTIQGIEVTVDTSREIRNIFIQKLLIMDENEVANWKFNEAWVPITKHDLKELVSKGASYIQAQFDWEKDAVNKIDAAESIDELKSLANAYLTGADNVSRV